MSEVISPEQCRTMAEVRAGVDALDRELVSILARRFAFMDAAARIKIHRGAVRDDQRKSQVIENVRLRARSAGISEDLVASIWEILVEDSIAYELQAFDSLRT